MYSNRNLVLAVGLALITLAPAAFAQESPQDPYAAVMKRDFGTAIDEMTAIEKDIEAAPRDQYPAFEDHLIAILTSPEATKPGKQFACQMLRIVGSPKCISAVAALLGDEQLSHMARYVLLPMHAPAADEALRLALGQTQGATRVGIINTLGDRRDAVALKPIVALMSGGDEMTGRAALNALGKIGGVPAATALDGLKPPVRLGEAWALAYLRVAENLATSGNRTYPAKMLRRLLAPEIPTPVRAAALTAYALDQKERSVPLILQNFASNDALMKRAAATAVINVPGHPATVAFTRQLPTVNNDVKPTLLAALATRGDSVGLVESVNRLTADADPAVRKAAILALGRLGDKSSVPVLIPLLKESATRRDASQALGEIHGAGVMEAIMLKAGAGEPETRSAVMAVLAQRGQVEALPVFRTALADSDRQVRGAGIAGLSSLGALEDLRALATHIGAASDDGEREEMSAAMTAIGLRVGDETARSAPVLEVFAGSAPPTKILLLTVLSSLGGDRALQAVQAALAEGGEVHKAAVRGLADWPSPAPMTILRTAAKEDTERSNRIVALRGYIRMIAGSPLQPNDKVQAYKESIALAERPDEKRQALAGLADTGGVESLGIVQPFLDDADVKGEAYLAYERIAEKLANGQPEIAKEALKRVADNASDDRLKNRARAALERIK